MQNFLQSEAAGARSRGSVRESGFVPPFFPTTVVVHVSNNLLMGLTDTHPFDIESLRDINAVIAPVCPYTYEMNAITCINPSECSYVAHLEGSHWIQVHPSETIETSNLKLTSKFRGSIHRNGIAYHSDSPHLISAGRNVNESNRYLLIHLPGTCSSPTQHHVNVNFQQAAYNSGLACVTLSYEWANHSDQEKNEFCQSLGIENCQEALACYHRDVCYGGSSTRLTDVHISGSILGRLVSLIIYLVKIRPETEKWKEFITSDCEHITRDSSYVPGTDHNASVDELSKCIRWDRLIISGHSQGSGHAAYLAQNHALKRLILFSGPQEGYVAVQDPTCGAIADKHCPHWLEKDFKTKDVYAMMHKEEEGTAG